MVVFAPTGNHSCEPNAEVTFPFNNSTLVLVAVKDIAENEVTVFSLSFVKHL